MRSLRSKSAAVLMALALSACGTTGAQLPHPDALYPIEMTRCAEDPPVPDRPSPEEPRSETVKAQYVANLRAAGEDCRDTVADWASRRDRYVVQWERETHSTGERVWRKITGQTLGATALPVQTEAPTP